MRRRRAFRLQISAGFVKNGAKVYICSRDKAACERTAAALTKAGPGTCCALAEDLSTVEGCERVATRLAAMEPALHVLVNNSGTSWGEPLETHSSKGWDKV